MARRGFYGAREVTVSGVDSGRKGNKGRMAYKSGSDNLQWKGVKAGYKAFHLRVEAARGKPKKCEDCGTTSAKRFEWASVSGNYSDVNDYKRLCVSCHRRFDRHPGFTTINHRRANTTEKRLCEWCRRSFRATSHNKAFCSTSCFKKHWRKRTPLDPKPKKKCEYCGQQFDSYHKRDRFCSYHCQYRCGYEKTK